MTIHRDPPAALARAAWARVTPEPRRYAGGRIGWPCVAEYEWQFPDGPVRYGVAPPPGIAYRVIVHDIELWDRLTRIGLTRHPCHTGRAITAPIDERRAPQQ